jgi:hypothetical protein
MKKHDPAACIDAFWAGERPAQIPLTMYWFFAGDRAQDNPEWRKLFDMGLRLTIGFSSFGEHTPGVEWRNESYVENGQKMDRQTMVTPVGEIHTVAANGWRQEYFLKTAADYRIMTWIARNTKVTRSFPTREDTFRAFEKQQAEMADHAIVTSNVWRTPVQRILVDYVGLENFAYHLADMEAEVQELYEAFSEVFAKEVEFAADGPGRYVGCLENFTAETMGPERFSRFHMPLYRKHWPVLQQAGKIIGTHYDGKLGSCKDLIARSPTNLIESLTAPPEGDMTLRECRQAWPEKLFWVCINVSAYQLPPAELKAYVHRLIDEAAPDGRRLAFEVSEDLPVNWRESLPVVLEALRERS